MDDLLTVQEVAEWLRVSPFTVYRLASELGATRVGSRSRGQLRIKTAAVHAYIASRTIPARTDDDTRSQ